MTEKLELHPDRALPLDPNQRTVARSLYNEIKDLPLVCMHGHVEADVFASNAPFADPAQLLIVPDHYVCRMLYSQGVLPTQMGIPRVDGGETETDSRTIWRLFCENWKLFRGTPSRFWLEHEFSTVFGLTEQPCAENADALYDQVAAVVAQDDFRPLQLLDRFNIEVISTTDPASSKLDKHASLKQQGYGERVLPTFRPDNAVYFNRGGWRKEIDALSETTGIDIVDYASYIKALKQQRMAFIAAGAIAEDHGHDFADTTPLSDAAASDILGRALKGETISAADERAFAGHMLFQFAGMACEDGLVMQIHPGVLRDHNDAIVAAHGADKGYDIPYAMEYTNALRPMLQAYGTDPRFRCILFTLDETVYTRELAPLAGVYSSVKLGAPWWFIDSPEGMRRFLESATETAGYYNMSGFVDDTRAYASIPARHDLYRRIVAGHLSRLVLEHRLGESEASEVAADLAYNLPKLAYSRPSHR